ncbi:hypothetical protein [Pseudoalteromonas denitrificans]|uniref:Uncharacterized protein n=1 Tax=Pseudoalteromonas denitrificans DSM 6059 TaxID=1123010 RepID=A0A1I1MLR9_9GAMM|nr:hypothetical protein [Pseudoalteromonas denitrificans]SFC83583.1 hypothetical protein SAMN02745724_02679 [Pseudoalteromonas denitrificans DSM 6059]
MKKLTLSLFVLISTSSFAQEVNTQALAACSLVENDFKRLLCYDQTIAGKSIDMTSMTTKTPVNGSKSQNKDQAFGLEHKDIAKDAAQEQTARVTSVKKAPRGELILTLENGQKWRQIGTERLKVKVNNDVIISRGVLNSFQLGVVDSNKKIRVKRVN